MLSFANNSVNSTLENAKESPEVVCEGNISTITVESQAKGLAAGGGEILPSPLYKEEVTFLVIQVCAHIKSSA